MIIFLSQTKNMLHIFRLHIENLLTGPEFWEVHVSEGYTAPLLTHTRVFHDKLV